MSLIKAVVGLCLSLFFSVGCQQKMSTSTLRFQQQQVKQLSALVAGSEYLKARCHRADIPVEGSLIQTALQLAETRGQRVDEAELQSSSQERLQQLLTSAPVEATCAQLNQSLSPFINFNKSIGHKSI
ncbi:type II secretion system pilot lipoprotein GspS [Serratia quinivorans]|uniref:type II secretion system pilot lipoprotein GspS n=1 Tax=Serratia quinivorans TaxID=137545 RepID=UPI0021BD42F8|nr:type II secretion system pilot lipoprotein GspS [Serratia quinivorans]